MTPGGLAPCVAQDLSLAQIKLEQAKQKFVSLAVWLRSAFLQRPLRMPRYNAHVSRLLSPLHTHHSPFPKRVPPAARRCSPSKADDCDRRGSHCFWQLSIFLQRPLTVTLIRKCVVPCPAHPRCAGCAGHRDIQTRTLCFCVRVPSAPCS